MKNIRTDMLKESIAEFTDIAKQINENTSATVNALLRDCVTREYEKIMAEGFDGDKKTDDEDSDSVEQDTETEDTEIGTEVESSEDEVTDEPEEESDSEIEEFDDEEEESTPEDWTEFEDYKIDGEDGQYDFSKADDDTLVKVYKLLKNSDEVVVNMDKEKGKLELKDNQTGAEYLIAMDNEEGCEDGLCDMAEDEDAFGNEKMNDIKESRMIEIVLNENSNLGYTDNYQSRDVMTTPSMEEPGKNVNDWDAGVPKSKSKPWAGKNTAKKGVPFTEEDEMEGDDAVEEANIPTKKVEKWGVKGLKEEDMEEGGDEAMEECNVPTKKVEKWGVKGLKEEDDTIEECGDVPMEEDEDMDGEEPMEEANLSQSRWNDTHAAHNRVPAANKDAYRRAGMQKTSKGATYRANGGSMDESIMKKHKQIVAENKAMKQALNKLQKLMVEATVTNMNLGQIVRILNENSTTQDEKREIIARFSKEAKTVNESKELYTKITNELKKRNTMDINEEKQFATGATKQINETTIHASKDLMAALDLMHKICK